MYCLHTIIIKKYVYITQGVRELFNMPKVSIIMPTYNVEKYFRQCIESVINQTLTDIEIIPVDDGSPDNCGKIMDEYATKDPRIKPIHQENCGYGKAVNAGIEAATGEYIGIVETDDYIEPDMYEKLVKTADENNAEIAKCKYDEILECFQSPETRKINWNEKFALPQCVFNIYQHPEFLYFHPSIWSCIYKSDFLKKHNIKFLTDKGASWTDNLFQIQTMCLADRIVYVDEALYKYRKFYFTEAMQLRDYNIPIKRCNEIHQWLTQQDIKDANVLACLYKREIIYIHIILGMLKIKDLKDAFSLIKQMINNMSSDIVETNQYIKDEERMFIKLLICFPLFALIIEKLSIYRKEFISIRFNRHEKSVRCFNNYLYKGNNNA